MKKLVFRLAVAVSLTALAGCNWGDTNARRDGDRPSAGEAAGKAAYNIKKGTQKAAKELSREIKDFRRDARTGYQEEKSKDQTRHPVDGRDTRP
jgi:hypothetical protein